MFNTEFGYLNKTAGDPWFWQDKFSFGKCSGIYFLHGFKSLDGTALYDHDDGWRSAERGQKLL